MKEVVEVERSTDGAIRPFSVEEIESGEMFRWVTKQSRNADGFVRRIRDFSGNTRTLKPITGNRPLIVQSGGLVTEAGRASLRFNSEGEYYSHPIPKSQERTIGLRANPDSQAEEHAILEVDGVGVSEQGGSIYADLYESTVKTSLPHNGDSTRIFVSCDGSRLDLNVDGRETSVTYSGSRSQTGQIYVGSAPNKISYSGTIQQTYVWEQFIGKEDGRGDVLGLLSEGSFLGMQMEFRFNESSNSATITMV